jgi:hypothetical protein
MWRQVGQLPAAHAAAAAAAAAAATDARLHCETRIEKHPEQPKLRLLLRLHLPWRRQQRCPMIVLSRQEAPAPRRYSRLRCCLHAAALHAYLSVGVGLKASASVVVGLRVLGQLDALVQGGLKQRRG